MRSLSPFWHTLHNKSSVLVGKLSKTMSYKLKNSPDYSFTMMWSFSITNELSIKIKTTPSSLSNLEYTFLCKQAARMHFFSFPALSKWRGEKGKKTTHNSQCSNKDYVLIINFYFTCFKELLSHRQRKLLVRGHAKGAYINGHTPSMVSFIALTSCFKFCFLKQYLCLKWYNCKQN